MASMLQKEAGMRIVCNQTDTDREKPKPSAKA
jgi:hypothetical protein